VARRDHRGPLITAAAALVIALASQVAPAAAQQAESAEDLFRRGVDALRERRFADAAGAFGRSLVLDARPATACNLALALERMGQHDPEAITAYTRCATLDTTGRFRDHALDRATALRASLAAAAGPRAPPPADRPPPPDPFVTGPIPTGHRAGAAAGPGPRPMSPIEPERDHTLLWVGIGTEGLAAGALIAGIVLATGASSDADALARATRDCESPCDLERGSREAELYESAQSASDAAIGLYIASGALAALGAALIAIDLVGPASETNVAGARIAVGPCGLAIAGRF